MNYKYKGQIPEDIQRRLFRAAEAAYQLDEEMSSIRDEIQEAQHLFNRKEQKRKWENMGLRIGIIHNKEEKSIRVLQRLRVLLADKDDLEIVEHDPELVITIGGDGTLLSAFHRYSHRLDEVRFLGVHTGHLGFYTDWRDYELPELVKSLSNEPGKSVSYPLLDVVLTTTDGEPKHFSFK